MAEKIIIAQLDIDMDAALKDTVQLKQDVEALKKATKDAKDTQGEMSSEYIQYAAALKVAQSELKTNENIITKVTAANNVNAGSVTRLEAANSALRAAQKRLNLETEEGVDANIEIVKQINANSKAISENSDKQKQGWMNVGQYTKALEGMPGPLGGIINGFVGMTKASLAFIATPIGAIMAAIALVVGGLVSVFKTFDPLLDKIAQGAAAVGAAFKFLKESVIGLITGQKAHNESMKEAIKAAIDLKKAEQDLEEQNISLVESDAKSKRMIDELLLQSKNRTKSEKERSDLIDQAMALEEKQYNKRKAIADKERELAEGAIITGRNLSKEQIALLKEKGSEYAFQLQQTKGITDEEIKTLANAIAKQENILDESVSLREKAQNRKDALEEKAIADAEKREAKRLAALEKAAALEAKANEEENARQLKIQKEQDDFVQAIMDKEQAAAQAKTDKFLELVDKELAAVKQGEENKLEAARINFENELALFDENGLAQIQKQRAINKQKEAEEIATAERIGADVKKIKEKYSKADKALAKSEADAKLGYARDFASNVSTISGENTKVGKAAAAAATAISTYQGATSAYAALAPIPIVGPVLGGIAAAAAVASGIANVKKIYAVQPGQTPSDSGSSPASVASSAGLTSSLTSVNTELGQGIVSRQTETGQANNQSATVPVLVVDKVTNSQKTESNKVATATI